MHSLVDDHSRLAYNEILDDERADAVAGFERAVAYFADHGIERIERLMTDNAWSYRLGRRLRELLAEHRTRHLFIKPHCLWQEREGRTL